MTNQIQENTFAAACFEINTIEDLEIALKEPVDILDMRNWGLSESELRDQIKLALSALKALRKKVLIKKLLYPPSTSFRLENNRSK